MLSWAALVCRFRQFRHRQVRAQRVSDAIRPHIVVLSPRAGLPSAGQNASRTLSRGGGYKSFCLHGGRRGWHLQCLLTCSPWHCWFEMSDTTRSSPLQEKADSTSSNSPSYVENRDASSKAERIQHERNRTKATSGLWSYFNWMGDLPEWRVRGSHLSGRALNISIGFIASCGFLMFGYDQGVLSALLTLDDFQKQLSLMTPRDDFNPLCWIETPEGRIPHPDNCKGSANTQAAGVAIYQIGCWLGSLVILVYGESWGRKSSTFWGSLLMIIGTIMQAACFEYGLFVAGRVVGGIGNGMVTSSTPYFI